MPRFVVQLHDATTLHFDLRLELGGVLRSWAVPKGPSLDPGVRRLAMQVPDHSLAAGDFEGVHAEAARGTGAVIVWDEGEFELVREEPEHLVVELRGHKLRGGFELGDLLADDAESAPEARTEVAHRAAGMRRALVVLPPRERAVIEARYGLGPDGPATVPETARRLRLRLSQVRHLEELALRRLRAAPETAALVAA